MAIGSPPPAENDPRSDEGERARPPPIGGLLLVVMVAVVGVIAWRTLRSSRSIAPLLPPAMVNDERRPADVARDASAADDPSFAERLLAAATAARRGVVITARIAADAREQVKSLELVGGFAPPPTVRAGETWSLASGEIRSDGTAQVAIPAAWPRLRALRVVRRDGSVVSQRDVALVGAPFDLGELPMAAGGPITGRVRADDGSAVTGARVAIFEVAAEPFPVALPDDGALGVTTTDAAGSFAFAAVAERHVRVEVGGVPGRADAVVADAELFGPRLEVVLPAAASIRGRLVDAAGKPVAAGRICARMNGPEEESAQRSASTDRDGAFALDALAPGYYTLFAIADGFAATTIARAHTDVAGLVVRLDRLANAHLLFVNAPADLETPVVWRTVEPVGATFRRTSAAELAWCRGRELVVRGIAPGRQALEVTLPGAAPIVTTVATFAPDETTELGTLSLERGAELALVVVDAAGRPLRARVALASPQLSSDAAHEDLFTLDHDERLTDADGRCVWPDLPAGRRVVAARALAAADREPASADAAAEVEIPTTGRVAAPPLVVRPAGAVAGRVRARNGPPLSGMLVQVAGDGARRSATTDLEGRYDVRGLLPGRYVVTVLRRDEAPPRDLESALAPRENPTANVDVVAGTTTARDFDLEVD